ncbi:MAG: DUF3473 domain-containing protein [Planctomycetes bacterium]|nr:DUF3473 domain-containing protein [Planctomycetota bacterium]
MCNALTIDVEDYFHVSGFESIVDRRSWPAFESRVAANTYRLLRLLERHGVRATFFVLGWVARRHPQLVRELHRAGHEIGCHSYWHRLVYRMSPREFRADLRMARQVVSEVTGSPVEAYRAPSYSITKKSLWALEVLGEEGVRYDSSIFPIHHDRYGIPQAPTHPYRIAIGQGRLWEFPPSVYRLAGVNVPVGSGGYLRLYPLSLTMRCLRGINARWRQPFVLSVHPWELDPEQPRLCGSRVSRFRHYVNLHVTEERLDRLLRLFRFGPLSGALERSMQARGGQGRRLFAD